MHDVYLVGECGVECTRLPSRLSRRGIDVNRTRVVNPLDERCACVVPHRPCVVCSRKYSSLDMYHLLGITGSYLPSSRVGKHRPMVLA